MLTIKSELKMLTEKSIYVIHNDLRGYTSPVKKGDLIAFGPSDGYCFDIIELTNDIDSKKMTSK